MFKLNSIAALLLSFVSVVAHAENSASNITIPSLAPEFSLTLGVVYLQPGADNLGWAATTTVLPIPSPNWKIHTINPTYQAGFTLGARYVLANQGADVQANWVHLNTSDTANVAVDTSTQWVSPFSQTGTPPTGGEITGVASLKQATGQLTFNYDVVNVDAGRYLNFGPYLQMRLFSGLSGIHIREELKSTFNGLPKVRFTLDNTSYYTGLGPRLGVNHMVNVSEGLNFVFQFAGSFLFGRMQPAQYQFTASGTDLAAGGIATNYERLSGSATAQVVPAVDTKLGINYLYKMRQHSTLNIEFGWMGALYFNPLSSYETNTNVIALDSGSLSTSSVKYTKSNFSVTGLYLTATVAI